MLATSLPKSDLSWVIDVIHIRRIIGVAIISRKMKMVIGYGEMLRPDVFCWIQKAATTSIFSRSIATRAIAKPTDI